MTNEEIIVALWKLLDDIDTLDDACHGDDAQFRRSCYDVQRSRFEIIAGEELDALQKNALTSNDAPVPKLWAECGYCKEEGEEECCYPVDDLRWNGEHWCCEECGASDDADLWQSAPRISMPTISPSSGNSFDA